MWLTIRLTLTLINTHLTTSIIKNQRKLIKLLIILINLRAISQTTQSYISSLRPYIFIFKILIELRLRILISLVIGSLIITIIRVGIKVYTYSLIKGLISRIYNYSLYYRATYYRQQLYPPYNWPSVIFIILQLVTISRSRWALVPPYYRLILIERQELANYILLQFYPPHSIIQQYLIVSRYYQFKPPLLKQLPLILTAELYINC